MLDLFKEMQSSPYIIVEHAKADIPNLTWEDAELAMDAIGGGLGFKLADYFKDYLFLSEDIWLRWDYEIDGKIRE
jgi:hypothetical protein